MRRTGMTLVALLGILLAVLLLDSRSHGQAPAKVKIGWNYHMGNAPAFVADLKGLFRKHGVEVEVRSFASGPSLAKALVTKEVDMAYVGFLPAFHDLDRQVEVTVLAKSSYGLGSILVRKDSPINTIQDLKGKKVAGSRKGSGNDVILRAFLLRELAKLDPEKDVEIVQMGPEAMGPVLLNRQVDAAMTLEPFTTQYLLGEETRVIVNTVDVAPRHPWYVVVARPSFIQQNRDAVVRVLKAHIEAVKFLNSNLAEANDLIAKGFKLEPVNAGAIRKVTHAPDVAGQARARLGFDYAISDSDLEFFEREVSWSRSLGISKATKKAKDIIDLSLMKEALR